MNKRMLQNSSQQTFIFGKRHEYYYLKFSDIPTGRVNTIHWELGKNLLISYALKIRISLGDIWRRAKAHTAFCLHKAVLVLAALHYVFQN